MKFGINTFLFTAPFTDGSVSLFPKFKAWGFDSVEIALENASDINPAKVREALDEHQLTCNSICAAMGSGRDFRGSQREQVASMDYLKGVLDVMPVLGANVLAGPLYSTVGRAAFEEPDEYKRQWDTVVGHLQQLAAYAGPLGITLAIEPLNRYETDFINTCNQALDMVAAVGSDHLKIHLDSYHMNIEEKDLADAILAAGDKLAHFHGCGSDRGTPGGDHTDWKAISAALKQIKYDGGVVIESFTPAVKVIAKAASIWRNIEPSQEDIAIHGVAFLKNTLS